MKRLSNSYSVMGTVLYTAVFLFVLIPLIITIFSCAKPQNNNDATTSIQNTAIDKSKMDNYSRTELSRGVTVTIPSDDKKIIPFELESGETMESFSYSSTLAGELYAFFTDPEGNIVLEHPLTNWQPGIYYLHIVNERKADKSRKVELNIRFSEKANR